MKKLKRPSKNKKIIITIFTFLLLLVSGFFIINNHFRKAEKPKVEEKQSVKDKLQQDYPILFDYLNTKLSNPDSKIEITTFFDNIVVVKENNPSQSNKLLALYAINKKKVLTFDDLFRIGFDTRLQHTKNIKDINHEILDINRDEIIVGTTDKSVTFNLEKDKEFFKAHLKIPSLAKNEFDRVDIPKQELGNKIAVLTYDDGPLNENHDKIRDYLDSENILASFFVLGDAIKADELNSKRLINTYLKGHDIGNHSISHRDLQTLKEPEIYQEIFGMNDFVFSLTGEDPVLFRPPYGSFNKLVKKIAPQPISLWNLDTLDWKYRNTKLIVKEFHKNEKDIMVILFHDLYKSSYEATTILVPYLKEKGYQFIRMSDLHKHPNLVPEVFQ